MNEFKVGDKVECLLFGKGSIDAIENNSAYPVSVRFGPSKIQWYTKDGRYVELSKVILTKGTWKVEEVLPEVTYKQGELVWCDVRQNGEWQLAIYDFEDGSNMHRVITKVGSAMWGVPNKCIRKFKDSPYDIND
mgnify:FL=1